MSAQIAPAPAEHVCYVHCNFCNTILAVSVPSDSMLNIVTVRCGHCTSLLSVNLRGLMQSLPVQDHFQVDMNINRLCKISVHEIMKTTLSDISSKGRIELNPIVLANNTTMPTCLQNFAKMENFKIHNTNFRENYSEYDSSSKYRMPMMFSTQSDPEHMLHVRPPEKRQRIPSAYNRFIKEEIRRIKANNPDISHREAFSTAAKNWAHFPNIHVGLGSHESSKKLDEAIAAPGPQKVHGLY